MPCPRCGAEHQEDTPCQSSTDNRNAQKTKTPDDQHALAGLDNPFWRPEKPAA